MDRPFRVLTGKWCHLVDVRRRTVQKASETHVKNTLNQLFRTGRWKQRMRSIFVMAPTIEIIRTPPGDLPAKKTGAISSSTFQKLGR